MTSNDIDSPRPHTAFIQIPHIDPGRDKYGNQPESLRRVLLLTWMVTIKIGHRMIREIKKLGDEDELSCRKDLCDRVIQYFNEEAAPLVKKLEKAKQRLYEDWRDINERQVILSKEKLSEISSKHARVSAFSYLTYYLGKS